MTSQTKACWLTFAACLAGGCEQEAPRPPSPSSAAASEVRIAVVPKGTTHDFWKSVHAGAVKAGLDLAGEGFEAGITFRGPEKEDDREQQIALMQNLISAKYDAIVLAPLDDTALVGPVRQATAAGIPVVIIDSGLKADAGVDFVSFVATDNAEGGRLAGRHMVELLGGAGSVLVLRYQEGSASTAERERGFLEAIAEAPGITVIDPKRYAGATRATAQEASEALLLTNSNVQGIFCPNESSTFGMLLALRSNGQAGKVRFVGFDASEGLVSALRAGEIDALTVQNPLRMGELGVRAAANAIRGETVELRIDTGVALVTKANMDEPEYKDVLEPDLDRWLKGGK